MSESVCERERVFLFWGLHEFAPSRRASASKTLMDHSTVVTPDNEGNKLKEHEGVTTKELNQRFN